jgi:hypothetical protein
MSRMAGTLLILGASIFMVGAAVGVPRVFTTPDPQARLRLLEQQAARWRFAQPLYAGGPVIAAVGVGIASTDMTDTAAEVMGFIAAVTLLVGAATWSYSCYLRAQHPADFALGKLRAWPFTTYAVLTIFGLAFLGSALLAADYPDWLGWLVLIADMAFLAIYAATKDLPPFVFYLLLIVVGVVLIAQS